MSDSNLPSHYIDGDGKITVDAPSGQTTQPVKEEERLPSDMVDILPVTEGDLEAISRGIHASFVPEEMGLAVLPGDAENAELRVQRFARGLRPLLTQKRAHLIKAVHRPTGKIIGGALWHEPGSEGDFPTTYAALPGVVFPSCMTPNLNRNAGDLGIALGWAHSENWNSEDIEAISDSGPRWQKFLLAFDQMRVEIMGHRPHWFLAPLFVLTEFRGKGVSTGLLKWGMEKAREQKERALSGTGDLDARFKTVCCYLESAATARPVYLHHGFKGVKDIAMVWEP